MQIAGAALVGSSESNYKNPKTCNNILLAGLAIQAFSFTVFLLILLLFRISLGKDLGARDDVKRSKDASMLAVAGTSLLVYLWTVFRLAETAVWQRRLKGCLVMCRRMRSSLGRWSLRRLCWRSGFLLYGIRKNEWSETCRLWHLHLYKMRNIFLENDRVFSRCTEDGTRRG